MINRQILKSYVNEFIILKNEVSDTNCINTHMITTCSIDDNEVNLNNLNKKGSKFILKYIDSIKNKKIYLKYYDINNKVIEKTNDEAYEIIKKIILCRKIKTIISKIYEIIIYIIFHKKHNTSLVENEYDSEDIFIDSIPYDIKCVQLKKSSFNLEKLEKNDSSETKRLAQYLIDNIKNKSTEENLFYITCISSTNNKSNTYKRIADFNISKDIFRKVKNENSLYNHFFKMKNENINVFMFVFITD